jgi:ParB-like chromosome segregation protein Spo0J
MSTAHDDPVAGEMFAPRWLDPAFVMSVPVADLTVADTPRTSGENADHVQALAAAQHELPPIIVHSRTMRVIDGVHRLRAATLRTEPTIRAVFFDGDDEDAFVVAVRANTAHGLPLSLADRKSAAKRIIASHPEWSDRMIANVTGLSSGTVAEVRCHAPAPDAAIECRIGRDGRARPLNASERRRVATELITSQPELSLREVAREAGISPETARNVRNRLLRGEDPVQRRQRGRGSGHPRVIHTRVATQDAVAILDRLSADPALKLSEAGRVLLRLLRIQLIGGAGWQRIADNVPAHCSEMIADLARDAANAWQDLADRVERKLAEI